MTMRTATQFKAECMRRLREKYPEPTPKDQWIIICGDCFDRGKDAALADHHAGLKPN